MAGLQNARHITASSLQLSLNIFLFDTNCTWSVGCKPDPNNSNNSCGSWEVNSSFRICQKNLASNQANLYFEVLSGENTECMLPCLIFRAYPRSQQMNIMEYVYEVKKFVLHSCPEWQPNHSPFFFYSFHFHPLLPLLCMWAYFTLSCPFFSLY